MIPSRGFIHVDIDPSVPGVAYAGVPTLPVCADIGVFVRALFSRLLESGLKDKGVKAKGSMNFPHPQIESLPDSSAGKNTKSNSAALVRPEVLLDAIQTVIVDGSEAIVMAESGNSFTWATHRLRFAQAERYRVSTGVGSMGHTTAGVIGAALGRGKAVAIVGDGSMLMNSEISTAVKYHLPAVWIVLNDARYNMCAQGMAMLGLEGADALIPETDFVAIARGMGADGVRVDQEGSLATALQRAMAATGPFVVDVLIDPSCLAPIKGTQPELATTGIGTTAFFRIVGSQEAGFISLSLISGHLNKTSS